MPKPSLMDVANKHYEKIHEYFLSGREDQLNEEQIEILDRWKSAYQILDNYPVKRVAIAKLREIYDITERQAACDITNTMKIWAKNNKYDRDFLENILLDKITSAFEDEKVDQKIKVQYAAILQKHLSSIPDREIDPRHIEQNNISICFNIANKNITVSEKDLYKLPENKAIRLLDALSNEITEAEVIEIINT